MKVKKIQTTRVSVKLSFAEALAISRFIETAWHQASTGQTSEDLHTVQAFGKSINPATKDQPK